MLNQCPIIVNSHFQPLSVSNLTIVSYHFPIDYHVKSMSYHQLMNTPGAWKSKAVEVQRRASAAWGMGAKGGLTKGWFWRLGNSWWLMVFFFGKNPKNPIIFPGKSNLTNNWVRWMGKYCDWPRYHGIYEYLRLLSWWLMVINGAFMGKYSGIIWEIMGVVWHMIHKSGYSIDHDRTLFSPGIMVNV